MHVPSSKPALDSAPVAEPRGARRLWHVLRKLHTAGLRWFFRRTYEELRAPTTMPGRWIRSCNFTLYRGVKTLRRLRRGADDHENASAGLYAFYDLDISPVTFDVCWFLVAADLERRRRGLDYVHCVVVPGRRNGLRDEAADYEAVVGTAERHRRVRHIITATFELLPSCTGHALCATRAEAAAVETYVARHLYPAQYATAFPIGYSAAECLDAARAGADVAVLRGTEQARRTIAEWLKREAGSRKTVTITLRDYSYMCARNSDLGAWRDFASGLDREAYFVVVIPDYDSTPERMREAFGDLRVYFEAAHDLGLRMALYEESYLNLAVNTGPFALCWLNPKTRYVMFKILVNSVPQANKEMMRQHGFDIGRSPSFGTPFQRWVWEDDSRAVIEREFYSMCTVIEQSKENAVGLASDPKQVSIRDQH